MSTVETRMALADARAIAERFVAVIEPYCHFTLIAGSIRRERPDVGDIEIVAVPKAETRMSGLFSDVPVEEDRLAGWLECMLIGGEIAKREVNGKTAWGSKYRRFEFEGAPFDLFCCDIERLGLILAIRTGPNDYSNALVTQKGATTRSGRLGMLPGHLRVQDGWLTYRVSGQKIDTPNERAFYDAIKQPWVEPRERR